jgi:hypothetical protein
VYLGADLIVYGLKYTTVTTEVFVQIFIILFIWYDLTIKRLTFKPKHMILRAENLVKTQGRSVVKASQ